MSGRGRDNRGRGDRGGYESRGRGGGRGRGDGLGFRGGRGGGRGGEVAVELIRQSSSSCLINSGYFHLTRTSDHSIPPPSPQVTKESRAPSNSPEYKPY